MGTTSVSAIIPDRAKAIEHLDKHVKYPATRAQLLAACENLSDFKPGEKAWFDANLPDRTYKNSAEVAAALKL